MSTAVQTAGVAGLFYPADPEALAAGVDASLARAGSPEIAPKAVMAPHAGHIYSGDIAGSAYRLLARRKGDLKRVVLLGPTHRMPVRGMALPPADALETPFGNLAVDQAGRDALARQPGVTVAPEPFVGEHSLEVHLPFIQRALGDVEVLPILVGQPTAGQVSGVLDQLWGGPETAIIVSSDLSHFHDYDTARAKDAETASGIERLQPQICEGHPACGYFIIDGLLDQARRRDLRVTALDVRNSGDTQGSRDRVVGYGSFAFEYAHSARLDDGERRALLDLAREVVKQAALHGGKPPTVNINGGLPRTLLAQRATFVTLKIDGRLRGCRGSVVAQQSLFADVANNAFQSGFGDQRFTPLSTDELETLEFEISILSTPRRIACQSEGELLGALRPDVDGIILRDGARQSLFLPSVWAQIPDPQDFIRHLKLKAGLPADHWSPTFEAFRFTTESFGDEAAGRA
ncbi:MAG TPA: AmmeMemoRadiSam system protein B [Caulobacteraceae bacterium]|nr:AmmeMemoRadiSam system protein B [Caulobacteraceae bacterium]